MQCPSRYVQMALVGVLDAKSDDGSPAPTYRPMVGDKVKVSSFFSERLSEVIYIVKQPVTGNNFETIVHHGGIEVAIHQSRLVLVERIRRCDVG